MTHTDIEYLQERLQHIDNMTDDSVRIEALTIRINELQIQLDAITRILDEVFFTIADLRAQLSIQPYVKPSVTMN